MILGRPAALWIGLAASAVNLLVAVGGFHWDEQQVAVINAFFLAVIAVLANVAVTGTFVGRLEDE